MSARHKSKTDLSFQLHHYLQLHQSPHDIKDWYFNSPRIDSKEVTEKFDHALYLMEETKYKTAEKILRKLIFDYPEFIDAYHHLAILLESSGRKDEAEELRELAFHIALKSIFEGFCKSGNNLIWGNLDNRPFLRLYHSIGLEYLHKGLFREALNVFENIMSLNPNDNQGARFLTIHCYFGLNQPKNVIKIREQNPDTSSVEILFGELLALIQLRKLEKAAKLIPSLNEYRPLVMSELISDIHEEHDMSTYYTLGGKNEASYYWGFYGVFWESTPGAIPFLKAQLQKIANSSDNKKT